MKDISDEIETHSHFDRNRRIVWLYVYKRLASWCDVAEKLTVKIAKSHVSTPIKLGRLATASGPMPYIAGRFQHR